MNNQIWSYVPQHWVQSAREEFLVPSSSEEYENLENLFNRNNLSVSKVVRYQNTNRYAQFLVRQQHLKALNPSTTYYTVRRYVHVYDGLQEKAKRHNLDPRRCGSIVFQKNVPNNSSGVVFVVQIVTANPDGTTFTPTRDTDYYIEYMIELE